MMSHHRSVHLIMFGHVCLSQGIDDHQADASLMGRSLSGQRVVTIVAVVVVVVVIVGDGVRGRAGAVRG